MSSIAFGTSWSLTTRPDIFSARISSPAAAEGAIAIAPPLAQAIFLIGLADVGGVSGLTSAPHHSPQRDETKAGISFSPTACHASENVSIHSAGSVGIEALTSSASSPMAKPMMYVKDDFLTAG